MSAHKLKTHVEDRFALGTQLSSSENTEARGSIAAAMLTSDEAFAAENSKLIAGRSL